jgi:uncharacterized membrane protein HdeD (DUF308 family)
MTPPAGLKLSAVITMGLGVAAILLPYLFGTMAVMLLAAVMLASGISTLLYVNAWRRAGFAMSVLGPWVQIVAGAVLLIWPELALWLVAVLLGGGLVVSGILGLSALGRAPANRQATSKRLELWLTIGLGVLLILLGAAGSALLLGIILGFALISIGWQRWRLAQDLA